LPIIATRLFYVLNKNLISVPDIRKNPDIRKKITTLNSNL